MINVKFTLLIGAYVGIIINVKFKSNKRKFKKI